MKNKEISYLHFCNADYSEYPIPNDPLTTEPPKGAVIKLIKLIFYNIFFLTLYINSLLIENI